MSDYRVYIVGDHGHFINAVEIDCADDAEATAKAQQLVDGLEEPGEVVFAHACRLDLEGKCRSAAMHPTGAAAAGRGSR